MYLDLVNNVSLIKNLSKDAFLFLLLNTNQQRKQVFESIPYLESKAPQL